MTCRRYREVLPLYVGKDLDDATTAQIRAHLEDCAGCRSRIEAYAAQTSLLRNYGRVLGHKSQAPDVWSRLRSQLPRTQPPGIPPKPFANG